MNDLQWPMLMCSFWQGFSLIFYFVFISKWAKPPTLNRHVKDAKEPEDLMSKKYLLPERLAIALPALVGCVGGTYLAAKWRSHVTGYDVAFLLGFPVAVVVARLITNRL